MQAKVKKKEERLKRIHKFHEKKREKEQTQKLFMENIERNMRIAESVRSGQIGEAMKEVQATSN